MHFSNVARILKVVLGFSPVMAASSVKDKLVVPWEKQFKISSPRSSVRSEVVFCVSLSVLFSNNDHHPIRQFKSVYTIYICLARKQLGLTAEVLYFIILKVHIFFKKTYIVQTVFIKINYYYYYKRIQKIYCKYNYNVIVLVGGNSFQ